MAAKCFRASAFAVAAWTAGADRHYDAQNRTSQFHAGAASMIVAGITSRDEYCLCVANGALCVILVLRRLCAEFLVTVFILLFLRCVGRARML